MKNTLLTIGDLYLDEANKAPAIRRFLRYRKWLAKNNVKVELVSYEDVLSKRLPAVSSGKLNVMLFFPYTYWNMNIEKYDCHDKVYGDSSFGKKFKKLFSLVDKTLREYYKGKDIKYVNPPQSCVLDRNKIATAKLLRKNGILTPKLYNIRNIDQLEKVLDEVDALYIKPVFGSMGKGISVVTKDDCVTNFIFRSNRIVSRPYDYNWKPARISRKRRNDFLNTLIKKRFIFEEAIKMPVAKRRQFDVRAYVVYGKVVHLFARSARKDKFVTNWSQGGRVEKKRFLQKFIPPRKLDQMKRIAVKAARISNLNYAGIDLILDRDLDKVYVLEVHSFPGHVRKFNVMKPLVEKIK